MKVLWEEKWSANKFVQSKDGALREIREQASANHEDDEPHEVEVEIVSESDQYWECKVRGIAIEPEKPALSSGCDNCQYFMQKNDEIACINPIVAVREEILEETGERTWAIKIGIMEARWPALMLKEKRTACPFALPFAGGQGGAAHPDKKPDPPDCKSCINHNTCTWEAEGRKATECQDYMEMP